MSVQVAPSASLRSETRVPVPAGRRRLHVARRAAPALVTAIVLVQIYPLVWVFLTSLRPAGEFAAGNPFSLPTDLTLENYRRAWEMAPLPTFIINSLVVTVVSNVLIVGLGMMAAYALTVLGFRGSKVVLGLFLIGIIVPVHVALVPLFITYSRVGLLDTYQSMILPLAGFSLPMSVYLFSSFYSYIPRETYEAAELDGAGPYRIFLQITAPLSSNTVITVVFVNSIFIWNDFVFANTFVLSENLKTIPLGLQNYMGAMGSMDWTATFAAVCVTVTPLLLIFLVLNKAIIYGLESGATKG
ncbi:carbohydrate ABC transporter permease [Nocardioides gansuensis]|uniref:carbohydrate ABC transporter permease n=1 Tax=Nocardioides gansuensis TaxID=2138300 RepID=UPI00147968EE|nr:carbohydrate ABC transporter permease [Nocardioides gansuensis]